MKVILVTLYDYKYFHSQYFMTNLHDKLDFVSKKLHIMVI